MSNKTKLEEVEKQKPGAYAPGDAVLAARQELAQHQAAKPESYQSAYGAEIDRVLRQITQRPGFTYDLAADPLYRQYQQSYSALGRQAAANAAANASALTGGYGNSYAATAAAQAGDAYLAKLGDVLPDLYAAAMERYRLESDTLAGRLGALQSADKTAYGRWADAYDNWFDTLGYLSGAADSAYKKDYNEYADRYGAWQDWRDYYAAQAKQDEEATLAREKLALAQAQWEAEQAFAREKWLAQQAAAAAKDSGSGRSGNGSGGSSGSGGNAQAAPAAGKKAVAAGQDRLLYTGALQSEAEASKKKGRRGV